MDERRIIVENPKRKKRFEGTKPIQWEPLPHVEEYLLNLAANDTNKDYISSARTTLARFSLWAHSEGIRHPDQLTRSHILMFQQHLSETVNLNNGEPLKTSYKQQVMKNLRTWIGWLTEIGYIQTSPWVRIRIGRTTKKPKPLETEDIAALFDTHRSQAFSITPFMYHRREVIIVILFGWGLRIHELASLNLAQMDMRTDWVTVPNKGGSTKRLPYGTEMKSVIQRYVSHRAKYAVVGEDALLIDQYGKRLSIQMIRQIITQLGFRANVSINPHRFRDTFGTTMLDYDVEVEKIMAMMGHTQRAQTMAYSRLNDPKVKESYDRVMNPLIQALTSGQIRHKACTCLVKHPESTFEIYTLRQALANAVKGQDQMAVQVHTAQLTTSCPGLEISPVGIED
jgi:site-specific recombinase XerD